MWSIQYIVYKNRENVVDNFMLYLYTYEKLSIYRPSVRACSDSRFGLSRPSR